MQAAALVLLWQIGRRKPSGLATLTRIAVAWVAVMVACGGLIVAWGIYALGHLEGFNR